jgi:hypothetical protein
MVCSAVLVTTGCTNGPQLTSGRHLTEDQVLALAKPRLPLPAGEAYQVNFRDGTWEVFTEPKNVPVRSWRVMLIRDSDGKVEEVIRF